MPALLFYTFIDAKIAGAACCGAIRNEIFHWHQLGAKDLSRGSIHNTFRGVQSMGQNCGREGRKVDSFGQGNMLE